MTARRNKKEKDAIDQMLDRIDFHGMSKDELTGQDGLLRQITKRFYERALQAELDEHLGYAKNDNAGDNSGNSRNGYTDKSVIMNDNSTVEIEVPRDRNSTFEPLIIPKHDRRAPLFNDQIISMYSFGMSCRDIQRHLQNVYGVEVSPELISRVTESVIEDVRQWRNRPLEKSYPIVFLDALRVNSRQDGKNVNKVLYDSPLQTGCIIDLFGNFSFRTGCLKIISLTFGFPHCTQKVSLLYFLPYEIYELTGV